MNKTVNINLAGTFFHIDEDAYLKLQRYLEAIKRSFTDSQGRDEIITDIEARIAELFSEKVQHDRQVISSKEVDEVITVMGQPEDYLVDEEIFDDRPQSNQRRKEYKQLFRDTENKYIGGVCSGLGHYLNIDAIWVRLLFILVTVFSGFGLIAYILFWILVPEAATTAQKLAMKGEPVNISNIEKKIKEGLEAVEEKVKNVDYDKIGEKVKKNSRGFFDVIGDIILFVFRVFAKFIGIILIIVGASALIGLFVGFLTVGITDIIHVPGIDFVDIFNTTGTPIWLISVIAFFAVGIPFFFLFYLGLRILVDNLNSIGNVAKFSLLGLWLLSIAACIAIGVRQASEYAYTGSVSDTETLSVALSETLVISMTEAENYDDRYYRNTDFDIILDKNDIKKIYSEDVDLDIKSSEDGLAYIKIRKEAQGSTYKDARERAQRIDYAYVAEGNTINLDNFLTTDFENKFRDQEIHIVLYIPEGTVIQLDHNTHNHIRNKIENNKDYGRYNLTDHRWSMGRNGVLKCLDCGDDEYEDDNAPGRNDEDDNGEEESLRIKINTDTINVKIT
ncbi:MAG: PspC domain-containing protein [Sinomicrobium sp.]|nr:PspC domain-containing protein [Sinomicrobium sp.]